MKAFTTRLQRLLLQLLLETLAIRRTSQTKHYQELDLESQVQEMEVL